jgi:carbon monoxide dehydrogenase subunit G
LSRNTDMKQIHLEGSWTIRAPRDEVYRVITDFENAPKYFPLVAKSARVVSRQGNDLVMAMETKSFGMAFQVRMTTRLCPPEGFVSENASWLGIEHEVFMMEEVPEGTKINYTNDVEIKSRLFRLLGRILLGWYAVRFWERAVIDKMKKMLEK